MNNLSDLACVDEVPRDPFRLGKLQVDEPSDRMTVVRWLVRIYRFRRLVGFHFLRSYKSQR